MNIDRCITEACDHFPKPDHARTEILEKNIHAYPVKLASTHTSKIDELYMKIPILPGSYINNNFRRESLYQNTISWEEN